MITVAIVGASRNAWGYLYNTITSEHGAERAGEKASYYFEEGTPPGRWAGRGAIAARLSSFNKAVEEIHLSRLFGLGVHPLSEAKLGKAFDVAVPLTERVELRAAALPDDLTPLGREEAIAAITEEELAVKQKQGVSGFEFVFSPPKSVSAWWALADPELKDEIRQAHQAAIDATITKLETDIVRTRTGVDGIAQEHVQGVNAALFDHWDSREGDPQLHTHMLVSNRVQGLDGKWRTIDSRWSLMPAVATAGAYYDTVLMDELSTRFGVEWTTEEVLQNPEQYQRWLMRQQRVDSPAARHQFSIDSGTGEGSIKWQLAGVPDSLAQEYSARSKQIRGEKDRLIEEYVRKHGRQPSSATIIKMRQQATLSTRRAKRVPSLRELTQSWRDRALAHVGDSFLFADRFREAGRERLNDLPLWTFRHDDVDDEAAREAAEYVLHNLAATRSTWGRTNAETGALRAIAGWRFRSPEDRDLAAKRVVDLVLAQAIPLTPKNSLRTPSVFRTADGEDMFRPVTRDLYTTTEVWDAEERLLEAGRSTHGAVVSESLVEVMIGTPTGSEGRILSDDQAAAVSNLLTSGRTVDVLVGPAGAGKTTSLEKLREIWEREYGAGSVRGLAPTARAAEVLAESLGIETENTAKWLHETARGTDTKDGFDYRLKPGDLMIVDEASIAGTIALDELRSQADAAGAKLLLVGDWAQLAAVDAGGAFGLLAADRDDVAELVNLHRFKADWEAAASKLLRLGKVAGLTPYIEHGRITHGFDETIIADAVEAWKQDEATVNDATGDTLVSLLIAPTNDMVERLNDIAREWRVTQGHVDATQEAAIASGVASPGDRIVTRQNDRRLRTDHDRWVKNNDEWVVASIDDATGDIIAVAGEETVTLPSSYCRDHVQLAYATTAHRSQGRTVDTAHTIVDSSASRETFYVAMTRGKLSNRAYVVIDEDSVIGDNAATGMTRTWRETLEHVVVTRGGDIAAHDTLEGEAERLGSIRQLYAEYQTLTAHELEREYLPTLRELGLIEDETNDSPYLGPLLANLRRLETAGADIPQAVTMLLQERDTGDARDVLAVLHNRVRNYLGDFNELAAGAERYGGLLDTLRLQPDEAGGRRNTLRLYRALSLLERLGMNGEEEMRNVLLSTKRTQINDPAGYVLAALKRAHNITDAELGRPIAGRDAKGGELIAGLLEHAPTFGDQAFTDALHDRQIAIQLRAEFLVDRAIANNEPWLRELGEVLPGREEEWRTRAVTVACFRDLYSITSDDALGRENAYAKNRERDRQIVAAMLREPQPPAVQAVGTVDVPTPSSSAALQARL
ncbi:MAG: relaxase domain-containing protein [Leucobacter sp.]|nr:relaxase domain-containing protein [Leucobacter sp.]